MSDLINAKYIKALIIDKLSNDDCVIGSEVMFANKKVVADLICLSNKLSIAFEIKAQNDDLRKVIQQMEEYNKVFDVVYLITTENHINKAQELLSSNNGIIKINNDQSVEIIRKPKNKLQKKLIKEEIISTMPEKFIKKHFNISHRNPTGCTIRESIRTRTIKELSDAMYTFLFNRISKKYSTFQQEKGLITHYEDLSLLSMPNMKII